MGRKKGKQSGEYDSKSERAFYRRTIVSSEARRNIIPTQNSLLGDRRGWCAGGGGGDKWSSIFKSVAARDVRTPHQVAGIADRSAASATSHLRHLLEERRLEDRVYDRQVRLRLQRSRLLETNNSASYVKDDQNSHSITNENNNSKDRHEPGWLLSYDSERRNENENDGKMILTIPSLQMLAAHRLGPLLPEYCTAIGSHTVGEALTPVSDTVLAELATSLANISGTHTTITDGVLRALVHSGTATGLVLKGGGKDSLGFETTMKEEDDGDDSRWLSDNGLLSLCPRFAPVVRTDTNSLFDCNKYNRDPRDDCDDGSSCDDDDWETLDYDMGLNSRMVGCFHLKRLELIDIPLQSTASPSVSEGISILALRTILRSCSNLTHLSLSGCFSNWESVAATGNHDDISDLLCGNQNISSLSRAVMALIKLHGHMDDGNTTHLVPQLMIDQFFHENVNGGNDVAGLDMLLPELKVLDVSHCSWVTPSMIIKYLLNIRCRDYVFTENDRDIVNNWNMDVAAGKVGDEAYDNCKTWISSRVIPLPLHINVRGCDELRLISQWIELLKLYYGLFDGVDLSYDRHDRRQL